MRTSRTSTVILLLLVTAAACSGKGDSGTTASAASGTTNAGGKKSCEDVGKNALKVAGTPYEEGQVNGYTAWCLDPANKLNQADIDCMANARDTAAMDKCRDDSLKHP